MSIIVGNQSNHGRPDISLTHLLPLFHVPLESLTEEQQEVVESAAEMLYGLIHARYILTSRGMQAMVSEVT